MTAPDTAAPLAVWLDCSAGIAGDMLLGALLDAGANPAVVRAAIQSIAPTLDLDIASTYRHGIAATKATVIDTTTGVAADLAEAQHDHHEHDHHEHHGHDQHGHDQHGRPWAEVRRLLESAGLAPLVRNRALGVFAKLATAEATVHGTELDQVHFHEVGSLDAIGDVVGCAAAFVDLGITEVTASVVTVGSGAQTLGQHGRIPIPGPAVTHLAIAAQIPTVGGPVPMEMTTPTGAALLAEFATSFGPLPDMIMSRVGVGAGTRDPQRLANVVRVVIGQPLGAVAEPTPTTINSTPDIEPALLLECNIDDLDPRLWPPITAQLLAAGAHDVWLTPILMKKGRPAHQLSVLTDTEHRDPMLELILLHTTTLGVRERSVTKHVAQRHWEQVEISGIRIGVKVGTVGGRVVNVQPEFADVDAAARQLSLPCQQILAQAHAAAAHFWDDDGDERADES